MCGIAGIVAFTDQGKRFLERILPATEALSKRGPDHQGILKEHSLALGHRRLSIIDTSAAAHQPMSAEDHSCSIVFNGEFFNFKLHRDDLIAKGHSFRTGSDTEVLLEICRREGGSGLDKVNGFFAFAFYDRNANKLLIARDRMGVKPLYYYLDEDKLIFGSELKALLAAGIPRELNHQALSDYLHLNYIPGNQCILSGVNKLPPGHFVELDLNQNSPSFSPVRFYKVPDTYRSDPSSLLTYEAAKASLHSALDGAVQRRLISDVPLGTFLSGGIDSSVITGLAARTTPGLRTFSIGFRDEPHFDETRFAELVARKHRTDHTVFSLTSDDLYQNLFSCLDYLDEPFADSSALAVNILSMHTRKHVTVALSGDGADELFGGYNKHKAEWILRNKTLLKTLLSPLSGLLSGYQGSRNSFLSNRIRQLHRFSEGASLSASDRYWRWCGFTSPGQLDKLLVSPLSNSSEALHRNALLKPLGNGSDLNDVLYMDTHMVLPDDMLVKVDRMSMSHALEVRSPFMDREVSDIAFAMPSAYKIDSKDQKKVLKDTFRDLLPDELLQRRKQGFEIPLLNWLRTGLDPVIRKLLLDQDRIREQRIFHPAELRSLYEQLHSSQPGDSTARMWGLLVFQYWWDKYFAETN